MTGLQVKKDVKACIASYSLCSRRDAQENKMSRKTNMDMQIYFKSLQSHLR